MVKRKTLSSLFVPFVVALIGCGAPEDDILSWEDFQQRVLFEPDTGVWVLNGDELAETEEILYQRYLDYRDGALLDNEGIGRRDQGLCVNRVGGSDDKWSSSQARNLTYCVSKSSFGSRYSAVVSAMSSAASAWEGAANVNLIHSSQYDDNCTSSTSGVVFDVRQVCSGNYLARAFFPSSSRSSRNILIDCGSFGNVDPWTLAGILRHEQGHALGFRHEHTRPEAGTCYENSSWRALTSYDSASVMHYPRCNGTNKGDLVLTSRDKQGAASLYR